MGDLMRGRHRAALATGWLAAAILLVGCRSAPVPSAALPILTGTASAAEGAISIETGEWTYGVPLDGVRWVDRLGVQHGDGRPECLEPGPARQVKFAAVEVTVGGVTWRPVVWVSCQ